MTIEILDAGENSEGYTYHISIPGMPGLNGDEYASLSEMFKDMAEDAFLQDAIDRRLNTARKAEAK